MEEFRGKSLEGEWWLPDNASDVFKGQLTISDEHDGDLILRGTEDYLANLPLGKMQATFFGRMAGKYRYEVTLFDTFVTRGPSRTFRASPEKETDALLVTNTILIGGHVRGEDETFIDGAILNLTGLDVWCDGTGFSGRASIPNPDQPASGITVTFRESASPRYDLGKGRTLRLLSELAGPRYFENSKQVTLREKNTIELLFPKALSIKQIMREVQVWQEFLILGLRRPSYIDDIIPPL